MEMSKENNMTEIEILNTNNENNTTPPLDQSKTDTKCFSKFRGILLGLLSELSLAISIVFIKKAEHLNGMEVGLIKYVIQCTIMLIVIRQNKLSILGEKNQRKLLIYRGFFSACCMLCTIFSLKFIDPSDTIALVNLNIMFVIILSKCFLKNEKLNSLQYFSFFLIFFGKFIHNCDFFL